jgi:hypothetical protein
MSRGASSTVLSVETQLAVQSRKIKGRRFIVADDGGPKRSAKEKSDLPADSFSSFVLFSQSKVTDHEAHAVPV